MTDPIAAHLAAIQDRAGESEHRIEVDRGDGQFRARCSCGWTSSWVSSVEATFAARQHLAAAK